MNNYPDNIRDYDGDPRSPFHVESERLSNCCHAEMYAEEDRCDKCGEPCDVADPSEEEDLRADYEYDRRKDERAENY